ncbi:MAG: alginate export family protein [Chlamydiae bacterium]|nr:alginate export family protein [Chlamydiota bacterium]
MKKILGMMVFLAFCESSILGADLGEWRLQTLIPKKVENKVKVSAEFRYRLEARDNFDFDDAKDDEDVFHLFRTRLNLQLDPLPYARGFVQFQDARIASSDFANDAPFEDPIDLRQGYVELYDPMKKGIGLRVGRQELLYGSERLIGAFNWSNVAQSFDAAKIFYSFEKARIDAFAARKVKMDPSTIFNEWDDEDNLIGLYGSCQMVPDHTFDLYYFLRDTDRPIAFGPNVGSDELSESSVGARLAGKQPIGLDYQLESAYQFGDFGREDISAWMFIGILGYTFDLSGSPRVAFEFDHASGDEDAQDPKRNTFDNLFPTNHLFYGTMDLASLQNINDFISSLSVKPLSQWTLKLDWHFLFLDETSDSLYNAARQATRTAESPNVSDEVGQELDFTLNYTISPQVGVLLGYSHFFAGDFLSDTGTAHDGNFFYFQVTTAF